MVVPTSKDEGSKLGGATGAGLLEFLLRAAWIGVAAGLEADGPVGPGVDGAVGQAVDVVGPIDFLAVSAPVECQDQLIELGPSYG